MEKVRSADEISGFIVHYCGLATQHVKISVRVGVSKSRLKVAVRVITRKACRVPNIAT